MNTVTIIQLHCTEHLFFIEDPLCKVFVPREKQSLLLTQMKIAGIGALPSCAVGVNVCLPHHSLFIGGLPPSFQRVLGPFVFSSSKIHFCVHTIPTKQYQPGNRTRVRFNWTKQLWCRNALILPVQPRCYSSGRYKLCHDVKKNSCKSQLRIKQHLFTEESHQCCSCSFF